MKTAVKSQKTLSVTDPKDKQIFHRSLNQRVADRFDFTDIFASVAPQDVIRMDDQGKVILDVNNPKHAEIRDRWLED